MKKRIFASALAVLMVLSLCACGGNAASSAATSAGSAAPEETKAAQEATSPAEAASAGEASTNEAVTEYESIEYPIEGDQLHHDFRQAPERGRGTGGKGLQLHYRIQTENVPPILVSSIGGTAICANK